MFKYLFHIRDYLVKTRHLSLMEDLAYRRLIDAYYTEEQPLPADIKACARLIAMRDHEDAVEAVLREYFVLGDAGWTNARCDHEIGRYRQYQEAGRKAAESRWRGTPEGGVKDEPDADAMRSASDPHKEPNAVEMRRQYKPVNQLTSKPETKPRTTSRPLKVEFDWTAGDWVNVEPLIPAWRDAYPGVDIDGELHRARAWVLANPDRAKSRWSAFLNKWMSRNGASNTVPAAPNSSATNVFEGLA